MKLHHYTLELFPYEPATALLARRCGLEEVAHLTMVARELMLQRATFGSDAFAGVDWGPLFLSFNRIEDTAAVVTWFSRKGEGERAKPFGGNFDAYSLLLSGLDPSADSAAVGVLRDNMECSETLQDQIAHCPVPAAVHVFLNPDVRRDTIICSAADALAHAFFALLGAEAGHGKRT